jgi:hypothetical protein
MRILRLLARAPHMEATSSPASSFSAVQGKESSSLSFRSQTDSPSESEGPSRRFTTTAAAAPALSIDLNALRPRNPFAMKPPALGDLPDLAADPHTAQPHL